MSIYAVGDAPTVTLTLPTAATVTLAVTDPGGAVTTPAVTSATFATYQATIPLTAEGQWVAVWSYTGAVVGTRTERIYALGSNAPETMLRPSWAPTVQDVAVHIPTRTRAVGDGFTNDYEGTFTADTTPTGPEVEILIGHACAWVTGALGIPVAQAAYGLAQVCAALMAAYFVELGYPERDADVTVYDRLRVDAETTLKAAVALNAAAGGGTTTDTTTGDSMLAAHTFLDPPKWADSLPGTYW